MRARRVLFSALVLLSASPLISEGVLHAQMARADAVAAPRHGVSGDARLARIFHPSICAVSPGASTTGPGVRAPADGARHDGSPCPAPELAPATTLRTAGSAARQEPAPSLRRDVVWGGAIGASMGLLSGLLVSAACGSVCDGTGAAGVAVHVGTGTVVGAAAGAVVHWLR